MATKFDPMEAATSAIMGAQSEAVALRENNVKYEQKSAEIDTVLKQAQDTIAETVSKAMQVGVAQKANIEAKKAADLESVDDKVTAHQVGIQQTKTIDSLIDATMQTLAAQNQDLARTTNSINGVGADGKPSFFKQLGSAIFGDEMRANQAKANDNVTQTAARLNQLMVLKSNAASAAVARASLATRNEGENQANLIKTQAVVDAFTADQNMSIAKLKGLTDHIGLDEKSLTNLMNGFRQRHATGGFDLNIANTLIQTETLRMSMHANKKREEIIKAYEERIPQMNKALGTDVDPKVGAHMMMRGVETGDFSAITAASSPEDARAMLGYMFNTRGGNPASEKKLSDRMRDPNSQYIPGSKELNSELQYASQLDDWDKKARASVMEKLGTNITGTKPEVVQRMIDEEKAKLVDQFDENMDAAMGKFAAGGGGQVAGEIQWVEAGVPGPISKELANAMPQSLKLGKPQSPEQFRGSLAEAYENLQDKPELQRIFVEKAPDLIRNNLQSYAITTFPEMTKSRNLNNLKMQVTTANMGIMGLDMPLFGGTSSVQELNLADPIDFQNFILLAAASSKQKSPMAMAALVAVPGTAQLGTESSRFLENFVATRTPQANKENK